MAHLFIRNPAIIFSVLFLALFFFSPEKAGAEPLPWLSQSQTLHQKTAIHADIPSLSKMIGQMILVGFSGTSPNHSGPKKMAYYLHHGLIGGVIFLGHNIQSRAQVRKLTQMFHRAGAKLRPLISIDQEGGAVQRLSVQKGFAFYPTARHVARKYAPETAKKIYRKLAGELASYGFNLNYGPVLDLNRNPKNPVIGRRGRSFSARPEKVIAYAEAFIRAHHQAGILTSAKHFPGHGSSWADSHKRFVDLSKSWHHSELAPYRSLAARGLLDMIMVGHLYHPQFATKKGQPATLSSKAIRTILRQKLNYQGIVITDDLEMAAIKKHYSFREAIIQAVQADVDILLVSTGTPKNVNQPQRIIDIILSAIAEGRISVETIENSYHRISSLKYRLH